MDNHILSETLKEFDYVFTDALTFKDNKGRRTRLWIPEETWIENEEQYMDMIVDRIWLRIGRAGRYLCKSLFLAISDG